MDHTDLTPLGLFPGAGPFVKAALGNPARVLHVRGDKNAAYGDVVGLLDELAAGGISRLSLVTGTAPASAAPAP